MQPHSHCVSPSESPESTPGMRRGPGRRRHLVLLVDPDTTWRTALALGLREAGFEVREVKGSDEAHGMLDRGRDLPHLVIAETGLEGTDGFTFCGELRADMATARVPVLLLSREQEEFHRDLAGGVGADDWLPRPVAVRDVVDLARLMAGRCASEPYESHTARLPLAHAVRALLAGTRSGRVVLRESDGWLTFRHGLVVDAAFAGQHGAVALRRLLCFGTGAYTVGFGPEPLRGPALLDREQLLTQVLPALERFEALRTVGLPLAARLTVDFTQLSSQLAALPVDVNTLLRLLDGRRTVRTVLLESPFSETVAYEALIRLYMLGVLVPACLVEERERARGGEAPRFPEPTLEADSVYPPLGH